MPHFMIVLRNTIYQFIKSFLDNKMSIFEECRAFMGKYFIWSHFLGITLCFLPNIDAPEHTEQDQIDAK